MLNLNHDIVLAGIEILISLVLSLINWYTLCKMKDRVTKPKVDALTLESTATTRSAKKVPPNKTRLHSNHPHLQGVVSCVEKPKQYKNREEFERVGEGEALFAVP